VEWSPDPALDQVRRLLRALSAAVAGGGGAEAVLQECCQAVVDNLDAAFARIWTLDGQGQTLQLRASAGIYTRLDGRFAEVRLGEFKIGRIASERAPHLTNDVLHDDRIEDHAWAAAEGMVAFAGHPLVVDDQVLGVLGLFARQALPEVVLDELAFVAGIIGQFIERDHAAARERSRLAEELHDTVSQDLYGISLAAQTAIRNRDENLPSRGLDDILDLTERAQAELRGLLVRVRPESIERGGLGMALQQLAASFTARHRIPITTRIEGEPAIGSAGRQAVYRIAQEALSNVARHAHATAVELVLRPADASTYHLEVSDDGDGFDPHRDRPGHFGLRTMSSRAAGHGWSLGIVSAAGAGTRVTLDFPGERTPAP
jgi:signal transduction histidine kinase